ncbi:hypothetical protein V6N11_014010 [Hibiscus sabdariffa]|uniref:Uncharacterized protein n=1 Tax=Hibiscus sabdariffa TaxID=183260 RepID=A0ABR2AFB4_9ROSI
MKGVKQSVASGNMGTIGTLTAKEAKEAIHRKIWRRSLNSVVNDICKSVVPVWRRINRIANSIKTDPSKSKGWPQSGIDRWWSVEAPVGSHSLLREPLDSRIFCFSGGGEQCSLRCGRCPPVGPGLLLARKNRSLASRTSGGPIWRHTENHAFRTERNARLPSQKKNGLVGKKDGVRPVEHLSPRQELPGDDRGTNPPAVAGRLFCFTIRPGRLSLPSVAYEFTSIPGRVQFPFDFSLVAVTRIRASSTRNAMLTHKTTPPPESFAGTTLRRRTTARRGFTAQGPCRGKALSQRIEDAQLRTT